MIERQIKARGVTDPRVLEAVRAVPRHRFVPEAERLWFLEPGWRNLFENTLTVQFEHRMLAYAIWLIVMLHAWSAWEARRGVVTALLLAAVLSLQALLGIVTLLYQAPIPLALAHQILAILTLTIAVVHAEALAGAKTVQVSTADAAKQGT